MSHDFHPLSSWPGCTVSRQGMVRGKVGPLSLDSPGRVSLRERSGKRTRKVYIGGALAEAGLAQIADRGRKKARIAAERATWETDGAGILEEFEL